MSIETQEAENESQTLAKLAICLWKLEDDSTSEELFKDLDKNKQAMFMKKSRKLHKMLENREISLTPKS